MPERPRPKRGVQTRGRIAISSDHFCGYYGYCGLTTTAVTIATTAAPTIASTFLAHVHILRLCVCCATESMGRDGLMTFLAHVHIFDATAVCLSCYGDHGGVGMG